MASCRRWPGVLVLTVAALPAVAVAHDGHATPTPAGPLAGVSPVGAATLTVGLLAVTSSLLLVRDGVVSRRSAGLALGVGAMLLFAGAALTVLDA